MLGRALAALLLVQAVLAPALCLTRGAAAALAVVEICTAEGLRTLHPPGEPGAPGSPEHAGFCIACHALPEAAAVAAPVPPAVAWLALGPAWSPGGPAAPAPAIRGPPAGARAPPSLPA